MHRRGTGDSNFLTPDVGDSPYGFVRQQHQGAMRIYHKWLDILARTKCCDSLPDIGIHKYTMPVLNVVEQTRSVENLKARLKAEQETCRRGGDFDRAKRYPLDSGWNLS